MVRSARRKTTMLRQTTTILCLGVLALAQQTVKAASAPVILSATINQAANQLTIVGQTFTTGGTPVVQLDGMNLTPTYLSNTWFRTDRRLPVRDQYQPGGGRERGDLYAGRDQSTRRLGRLQYRAVLAVGNAVRRRWGQYVRGAGSARRGAQRAHLRDLRPGGVSKPQVVQPHRR